MRLLSGSFVSKIAAYPATRTVAGATKGTGQTAR
jgi:hypothetical protein